MIVFYIELFFVTLLAFFAIDIVWLAVVSKKFYSRHLGYLMAPKPRWAAAIVFYLLFIGGLLLFVVAPGLQADSLGRTLLLAACFGLVTYATYDLTNLATVKDWPLVITIVDLAWGTTLSILVSLVSFLAGKFLL